MKIPVQSLWALNIGSWLYVFGHRVIMGEWTMLTEVAAFTMYILLAIWITRREFR